MFCRGLSTLKMHFDSAQQVSDRSCFHVVILIHDKKVTTIIVKIKVLHLFLGLWIPCKWLILGKADVRDGKSLSPISNYCFLKNYGIREKETQSVVIFLFCDLYILYFSSIFIIFLFSLYYIIYLIYVYTFFPFSLYMLNKIYCLQKYSPFRGLLFTYRCM